jgi:hypothetical protein
LSRPLKYVADSKEPSQVPVPLFPENSTAPKSQPTTVATEQLPTKEELTVKEKLVYGCIALLGIGGSAWFITHLVRKKIANAEEKKSFEEGTSATTAKKIKMAFENDGWWGTNTKALREELIAVPSKEEWDKVKKSYEKLYSTPGNIANLITDLSDELQSTEYNEMLQIIGNKPERAGQTTGNMYRAWAKRFKAAFDKSYGFLPGTDSEAVSVTLREIPTQQALVNTGIEYKKLYSTNLMKDLEAEGEFGQWEEWKRIIAQKKKN